MTTTDQLAATEIFQFPGPQLPNRLDSITDGFIALDLEWRVVFMNRVAADMLSAPAETLIGRRLWDAFAEFGPSSFGDACRRAVAEGIPIEYEDYYLPSKKWLAM